MGQKQELSALLQNDTSLKSVGSSLTLNKTYWQISSRDRSEKIDYIVNEVNKLLKKFPKSPEFLGKDKKYPPRKKGLFSCFKPKLNIENIRNEVNRFAESKEIINPCMKIKKLLKHHPYDTDIRALNGIQTFTHCLQSGVDQKKLDIMEYALKEVGSAINNWGLSMFNVNWFLKIYLHYLEKLKARYSVESKSISGLRLVEVNKALTSLNRSISQAASMLSLKDKLSSFSVLSQKSKGTVYMTSNMPKDDIVAACHAIQQEDPSRTIGQNKTASHIILIVLTLALLLARIPMFRQLVQEILSCIPETTRDFILQKHMIQSILNVTDFQIAISSGENKKSRIVAHQLFNRCTATISQHLEYSIPTKPYEVDPFLKVAWIVKESNGLVDTLEYKEQLKIASGYLEMISSKIGKVKGAFDIARQLQMDLRFIKAQYGWL